MSATILPGLLLATVSGEGGGGGLTDVNFTLTVATIVLFVLFAAVLTKFGWKPLLHLIEEREKSVKEAVEGAEKANAEAQALLDQHREMLRQASREREEVLGRALKEAEQIKADLLTRARTEGEQLVLRAREQVEREKTRAVQELRGQVAELAVAAAAKIVTSSLTPEIQKKLVTEFIDTLPRVQ
jgi:F-type H+-transporting ATPase subunit b